MFQNSVFCKIFLNIFQATWAFCLWFQHDIQNDQNSNRQPKICGILLKDLSSLSLTFYLSTKMITSTFSPISLSDASQFFKYLCSKSVPTVQKLLFVFKFASHFSCSLFVFDPHFGFENPNVKKYYETFLTSHFNTFDDFTQHLTLKSLKFI